MPPTSHRSPAYRTSTIRSTGVSEKCFIYRGFFGKTASNIADRQANARETTGCSPALCVLLQKRDTSSYEGINGKTLGPVLMDLHRVDWSQLPPPTDDGAARHLEGAHVPRIRLRSTDDRRVDLATLAGRSLVYVYPMTGRPDRPLPAGWDATPGARGCTPQACSFRDHAAELKHLGVSSIFGLSTQSHGDQLEAARRLHLPYPLLCDMHLELIRALKLPTFVLHGDVYAKRLTMLIDAGVVTKVFYPVFPPDESPRHVIAWLNAER